MSRSTLGVLGVLVLFGLGGAAVALSAREPQPQPAPAAAVTFQGKALFVESKMRVAATLEKAQLRTVSGRAFIVGKEVRNSPYTQATFANGTVWIPLEDVSRLVELEDLRGER